MERKTERQADLLDHYWDAVASGEETELPSGIDALTAAILARLGERNLPSDLDAVNQRIRSRITNSAAVVAAKGEIPAIEPATPVPAQPSILPSDHHRPWFAVLAAAAALLVASGLAYAVFGFDRSKNEQVIPAVVLSESTPIPEPVVLETLFEYSIQDEGIPPGEIGAGITNFWVPAGRSFSWEPYCCSGILVEYILSGELTFVFQDEIRVVRKDQSEETIPSNTSVVLGPGDTLVSRIEVPMEATNDGSEHAELLNWTMITDDPNQEFHGYLIMGWTPTVDADVQGIEIPTGEANVRLQRILLPPGSVMSPEPGQYNFVVKFQNNMAGTPQPNGGFARFDDANVENRSTGPFEIWVLNLEVTGATSATPGPASPTPT